MPGAEDEQSQTKADDEESFGRGFLTRYDRQFLRGDADLNSNAERQARHRIKERTRNAMNDFRLLYEAEEEVFDREDRMDVFDPPAEDRHEKTAIKAFLTRGSKSALSAIYEWLGEEKFADQAEKAISEAVTRTFGVGAANPQQAGIEVELNIDDIESVSVDELASKLDNDQPVEFTNPELSILFRILQRTQGRMPQSGDEFRELFEEFWDEEYPFGRPEGVSLEDVRLAVRQDSDDA